MHDGCPLRSRRCRSAGERSEPERRHRRVRRSEGRRRHLAQRTLDATVALAPAEAPSASVISRSKERLHLLPQRDRARRLCVPHPVVEPRSAQVFAGCIDAHERRRQRKVDVLREPVDRAEDLRERGPSLEDQAPGELAARKYREHPTHPEVLLDDDGTHAAARRCLFDRPPRLRGGP